jgi:hypothetical protein
MPEKHRRAAGFGLIVLAITAVACAKSLKVPVLRSVQHAELKDQAGDAVPDSRIAVPPDLISATVDEQADNIAFAVQFAHGTLDRMTTWIRIELDTDENSTTGNRERNGMGSDYTILLLADGRLAAIQKFEKASCAAGRPCHSAVGSVPMKSMADSIHVVVPFSLLGNDDGHMLFQVRTFAVVGKQSPVSGDSIPNDDVPPGRI